jgi:hypothetical protein
MPWNATQPEKGMGYFTSSSSVVRITSRKSPFPPQSGTPPGFYLVRHFFLRETLPQILKPISWGFRPLSAPGSFQHSDAAELLPLSPGFPIYLGLWPPGWCLTYPDFNALLWTHLECLLLLSLDIHFMWSKFFNPVSHLAKVNDLTIPIYKLGIWDLGR